jgi:hypothetical protein
VDRPVAARIGCSKFDAPRHHTNERNEMAEDVGYANQWFDEGTRRQDGFPPGRSVGGDGKTFVGAPQEHVLREGTDHPARHRTLPLIVAGQKADVRMQVLLLDRAEGPEPRWAPGE